MKEFWDDRYAVEEFVYGTEPNTFFKEFIDEGSPGSILLPSEGEGRNSVYAARNGWQVHAIDYSLVAREKAMRLARKFDVNIQYYVEDIHDWNENIQIDSIGLIYAHFHSSVRESIHRKLIEKLKPGGTVLLEAFSIKQLLYKSGGPKSPDLLYDKEKLNHDFASLKIEFLEEIIVKLDEGDFHKGVASVIRMIAKKK